MGARTPVRAPLSVAGGPSSGSNCLPVVDRPRSAHVGRGGADGEEVGRGHHPLPNSPACPRVLIRFRTKFPPKAEGNLPIMRVLRAAPAARIVPLRLRSLARE